LLRELGFDARLAGGLYLSREQRDGRSRRLLANGDDAHFWAEVRDTAGRWVPVEATPGYSLRPLVIPWWHPARDAALAAVGWVAARPIGLAAAAALAALTAILAARLWRPAADFVATLAWWWAVNGRRGCLLSATWRLLEWRAWLAGRPRPHTATPRGFYLDQARPRDPTAAASLAAFIAAFEWRMYGPASAAGDESSARGVSLAVARLVTRSSLRGESVPRASAAVVFPSAPLLESPA